MDRIVLFLFLGVLVFQTNCDNQDLFSLMNSLQPMLAGGGQFDFMYVIQQFLEKQNLQFDDILRYIKMFARMTDNKQIEDLLDNPMELVVLLQQFMNDWHHFEDLLTEPRNDGELLKGLAKLMTGKTKASKEDVNEAALAVVRIQDVYNLSVVDVLSGKLGYFTTNTALTVNECLRLGQQSLANFDLDLTVAWFEKALLLKNDGVPGEAVEKLNMIHGFAKSALKMLTPDLLRTISSIPGVPSELFHHFIDKTDKNNQENKMLDTSKKLCRGEELLSDEIKGHQKCIFIPHDVTRELQRIKIEYLSYEPLVTILHDVVSNKEIDKITELVIPNLQPVKIHKYDNNNDIRKSNIRTGKSAWIPRDKDTVVKDLYRRVEDFTGLSTTNAEPLQVVNYQFGGHYEVHTDFFNTYSKKSDVISSDRVATLLLYLSDVYAGGYTVFPHLQLAVKPEKGAALFWFNLLRSGEGDFRMVHAACPVLSTDKWAANLWILEEDQMFHRPCSLNKHE